MTEMIMPEPGDIKAMGPEELLKQFRPLVIKVAKKYLLEAHRLVYIDYDDLLQTGYFALFEAQKAYDPDQNASFFTYAYKAIYYNIARLFGWRWQPEERRMKMEPTLIRLDAPISDDDPEGRKLVDIISDSNIEDFSEDVARQELAEAVHEAINRMKNERQRDYINRIYFQDEPASSIAEKDGTTIGSVNSVKAAGLRNLRQDYHLREYRPHFSTSLSNFRYTFTSEEEAYMLWAESREDNCQKKDNQEYTDDGILSI